MNTIPSSTIPARTNTPDHTEYDADGHPTITFTMKRGCNGCGTLLGDVTDAEADRAIAGLPSQDVRAECPNCAPLVDFERAGCRTWHVTERSFLRVMDEIDRLRPWAFTKGYTRAVGPKKQLTVVGLRVGERPDKVVAFWGDWLIQRPDGTFSVHKAPTQEGCEAV